MTPALRILERWLPPASARLLLLLIYAASVVSILCFIGYEPPKSLIYLDVQ
jgi:hypothetical protein